MFWWGLILVGGVLLGCANWLEYIFSRRDARDRRDAFLRMLPLREPVVKQVTSVLDETVDFLVEAMPVVLVIAFCGMVVLYVVMPMLTVG